MRIDVRGTNIDLQPALGAYAERRFNTALRRFERRLTTVSIRLIDVNGPKKGADKKVQVTVDIPRTKPMVLEELHPDPYLAIDTAADRIARVVAEAFARRRSGRAAASPRHSGTSPRVTGAVGVRAHSSNEPS